MRVLLIGLAALSLAACDSGKVPSPAERQSSEADQQAGVDPSFVSLGREGLSAGSESFFYAAGENEVKAALAASLGEATEIGSMPECGAGPMEFASYPGGLTVNFQNGSLAGWNLDEASQNIKVAVGTNVGMTRAEIEADPNFSLIADSTLGEEFIISGELAGFIEDDQVSMLYSGVQCFFR